MAELSAKLGFLHEKSTPYYAQDNGQVEAINKVLNTVLCIMVGYHKSNWHLTLFSALWAIRTSVKTTTGFMSFQLVDGLEAILPIECDIPSLKLTVDLLLNTSTEEERFLYLTNLDENQRDVSLANEVHKNASRLSMINPFNLVCLMKVTWF